MADGPALPSLRVLADVTEISRRRYRKPLRPKRGQPSVTLILNGSRQVDWYSVHLLVTPLLVDLDWPLIGTTAWSELPDDHPAKWGALLDAAQHCALFLDGRQEALVAAADPIRGTPGLPTPGDVLRRNNSRRRTA